MDEKSSSAHIGSSRNYGRFQLRPLRRSINTETVEIIDSNPDLIPSEIVSENNFENQQNSTKEVNNSGMSGFKNSNFSMDIAEIPDIVNFQTSMNMPEMIDSMDTQEPEMKDSMNTQQPLMKDLMVTKEPLMIDSMDTQHPLMKDMMLTKEPLMLDSMDTQHPLMLDSMNTQHPLMLDSMDTQQPLMIDSMESKEPLMLDSMDTQQPLMLDSMDTQQPLMLDSMDTKESEAESQTDIADIAQTESDLDLKKKISEAESQTDIADTAQTVSDLELKKKMNEEEKVIGNNVDILNNLLEQTTKGFVSDKSSNSTPDIKNMVKGLNNPSSSIDNILSNELSKLSGKNNSFSANAIFENQLNSKIAEIFSNQSQLSKKRSSPAPTHKQSDQNIILPPDIPTSFNNAPSVHSSTIIPGAGNLIAPMNSAPANIPSPVIADNQMEEQESNSENTKRNPPVASQDNSSNDFSPMNMVDPIEMNRQKAKTAPSHLNVSIDDFQKRIQQGHVGRGPIGGFFGGFGPSFGFPSSSNNKNQGESNNNQADAKADSIIKEAKKGSQLELGFNNFSFDNFLNSVQKRTKSLLDPETNLQRPAGIPLLHNVDSLKSFIGSKGENQENK